MDNNIAPRPRCTLCDEMIRTMAHRSDDGLLFHPECYGRLLDMQDDINLALEVTRLKRRVIKLEQQLRGDE